LSVHTEQDALLAELICHSLLNLYLSITYQVGYVTVDKRTQLLLKYYKLALKNPRYKPLKSDIRGLIHYGRKNARNFEAKINEINDLSVQSDVVLRRDSDLLQFKSLLERLGEKYEFGEVMAKEGELNTSAFYFDERSIESAFSINGNQIKPIKLVAPKAKWEGLCLYISQFGWKLDYWSDCADSHIVGLLFRAS